MMCRVKSVALEHVMFRFRPVSRVTQNIALLSMKIMRRRDSVWYKTYVKSVTNRQIIDVQSFKPIKIMPCALKRPSRAVEYTQGVVTVYTARI